MPELPSPDHLRRYADVLVNFALGDGAGIKRGDVVLVQAKEVAKPLYAEVCQAVWRAGGHVIDLYQPAGDAEHDLSRRFYELASDEQLDFFPATYLKGLIDQCDHAVHLLAEDDPRALEGVEPARIVRHQQSLAPMMAWQIAKESAGRFTWTVALYGTEAMAAEAHLPFDEYWEQIVSGCFLDDPDPAERWREVQRRMNTHKDMLNGLPIERLHVEGEDVDLWITLGDRRRWVGAPTRNVPSFEIFTSPDWRGTEGWVVFSEPLYCFGKLIRRARLEFDQGRVVAASAAENEDLLKALVATDGADRVGEFSLTDQRLSRITRFMACTLFDENVGGRYGNTHLALGQSLPQECYDGDPAAATPEELRRLGFNESAVHTDIVSTSDRTVTATLAGGSTRVIYADGQFAD